jgi:hypothetical protein
VISADIVIVLSVMEMVVSGLVVLILSALSSCIAEEVHTPAVEVSISNGTGFNIFIPG